MKLPGNVSESVKRRNPHLFGMAGLPDPKRERSKPRQNKDPELEKSTRGVGYRVTIVSVRKRFIDAHDNLRTGSKALVDAITRTLGFSSDDNPRLQWEYGQVLGTKCGTIVKIELV